MPHEKTCIFIITLVISLIACSDDDKDNLKMSVRGAYDAGLG
jgi:hypothetical protein